MALFSFQLDCIRRCGHTHQFFFLELGRSAKTGSGNLWLQVEDNVIAQNIHEALLRSAPSISMCILLCKDLYEMSVWARGSKTKW